jgi:hypothetical protein
MRLKPVIPVIIYENGILVSKPVIPYIPVIFIA